MSGSLPLLWAIILLCPFLLALPQCKRYSLKFIFNYRASENGGALVECAMILPFMGLMLFGITEVGYRLAQLTWINSSLCQAVELGTATDQPYGGESVKHIFSMLYGFQNDSMSEDSLPEVAPSYQDSGSSLRVNVSTKVNKLFGLLDPTLNVHCNAAYFSEPIANTGSYDLFLNESSYWSYNCEGQRVYGSVEQPENVESAPCAAAQPPADYLPPHCFAAETQVSMADGTERAISQLKAGDKVLAFDENSKTQTIAQVTHLHSRMAGGYFVLNDKIKVTEEHPFYVEGRWVPTSALKLGDNLMSIDGQALKLKSKEKISKPIEVFNVTVDQVHTYYAAGILVHNKPPARSPGFGASDSNGNLPSL